MMQDDLSKKEIENLEWSFKMILLAQVLRFDKIDKHISRIYFLGAVLSLSMLLHTAKEFLQ